MIYVLSGGQTGATLTVTSSGAGTITVSNTTLEKSYSKSVTAGGSAVFKGLATGTWVVKLTDGSKTSTKNITITSDYSTSIAYFSATIKVTYPAKSKCIIKNSSGTQVASNTNTGTSAKTWTATVNAKGTYTVTATATDGSGKSKSQSVSITADGQSKSVELYYWDGELYDVGNEFTGVTGGWVAAALGQSTGGWSQVAPTLTKGSASMTVKMPTVEGNGCIHMTNSVDMSKYTTLKASISAYSAGSGIADQNYMCVYKQGNNPYSDSAAKVNITKTGTYTLDISSLSGNYDVAFGCANNGTATEYTITKVWLE